MAEGTESDTVLQIDLSEGDIRKAFLSKVCRCLRDVYSNDSQVADRFEAIFQPLVDAHVYQALRGPLGARDQNGLDQQPLSAQLDFIASLFITSTEVASERDNPEEGRERKKLAELLKNFLDEYVQLDEEEFKKGAESEAKLLSTALGVKLVHTLGKIYTSPEPGKETAKKPEEEAAKKPGKETAKKPGEETAENPGKETAMKLGEETAKKESNLVDFGKTLLHECLRVLSEEDVNKVHNYHEHLKRLGEIYLQIHGESSERANDEGSSSVSEKKAVSIGDVMLRFLKWLVQSAKESAKKGFDPNEG